MTGFLTHLASAEDLVASQNEEQAARFQAGLNLVRKAGIEPEWIHVSNSAAMVAGLKFPENLVRVGALFSGYCLPVIGPAPGAAKSASEFEPLLTFKSRVVYLKDVPSSTPLGYGAAFHTRRTSRIATVPVGYADGLSRGLSNRGRAIVRDRYARIVGNVSMDLTLLDVTDIPGVDIGDEVILLVNGIEAAAYDVRFTKPHIPALLEDIATLRVHPSVGDVRGLGLLAGIEFVRDRATKAPFDPVTGYGLAVVQEATRRGLLVYPGTGSVDGVAGDHVLLAPPFIITREQIDTAVGLLDETLIATEQRYLA